MKIIVYRVRMVESEVEGDVITHEWRAQFPKQEETAKYEAEDMIGNHLQKRHRIVAAFAVNVDRLVKAVPIGVLDAEGDRLDEEFNSM